MYHSFKYFQNQMYKNTYLKIKRSSWNNKYIRWSEDRQLFVDDTDREWAWNDYEEARRDICAVDWTVVQ